ncbi:MAG TPA: hypothetical protein VFP70_06930 [Burkholderiales bacterium]|nr:hypothetical protein [Burkholderiales bacterium]
MPEHQRGRARRIGLSLAMATRTALLLSPAWTWIVLVGGPLQGYDVTRTFLERGSVGLS